MQGYCSSGAYTSWKRLKDGIMDNVYFYAAVVIPCIPFVLYAIFGIGIPMYLMTRSNNHSASMLDLAIPLSNAYGLAYLTLMMSVGLVEIPRSLWFNSNVQWKLKYLENEAPSLKEACVDAETEIYEIARIVANVAQRIIPGDPLRPKLDKILERCPLALNERTRLMEEDTSAEYDEKRLALLHGRIKRAQFLLKREQARLKFLEQRAFLYQDMIAAQNHPNQIFESVFWPIKDDQHKPLKTKILWWWLIKVQPIAMKVLSVVCGICSVLVIWSESTFQITGVTMSIPGLILKPDALSYFNIELLVFGFIAYMCTCSYSTLLKLKLLDFYLMVPNHHTDEQTLLFVGAYMCKLIFPLCYNFLNMGGLAEGKRTPGSSKVDYSASPAFIQYFGPAVDMAPLLGNGYNDWIAFVVLILCTIIFLNLHGKILRLCSSNNYFYENIGEDKNTTEGRQQLEQARTLELRRLQREGRNLASGPPRATNTADLLARYAERGSNPAPANTSTTSNHVPVDPFGFGSTSKTTTTNSNRSFGVSVGSSQASKGYQKLVDDDSKSKTKSKVSK
ncbi:LMBR1 domain-containing protein 2 [Globomyces sp. JEL0801]|nr:LMBR1 domain-containing protein 2 [Globomyces sp. JEL0801]